MVAPICRTVCGAETAAAVAAAVAAATGCCPPICATAFTTGNTTETVPEFDTAVADGQLVEVTVTGYVTRTDGNIGGIQGGFVYLRGMARRFDADTVTPGLDILLQNTTLQSLSAGLATTLIVSGNTLQVQIDGDAGTYRWDLEMERCVQDQVVDIQGEA